LGRRPGPSSTRRQSRSVRRRAKSFWSYTAQCPGKDLPYWELDFPLLNYRIPAWTSRRYGLTGLYYWTIVYWPEIDPWLSLLNYKQQYNGEGILVYPGRPTLGHRRSGGDAGA